MLGEGKENDRAVEQPLTPLTQKVRALYEGSVVPVREIARLAGVSERTLYKYVQKGGWRRRHATQDLASAVSKRAQMRKPQPCVTAKGAGGRFIPTADAGRPFARGLKALDPGAQARALARCRHAAALADDALGRSRRLREALSDARVLSIVMAALRDLAALEDAGKPAAAAEPKRDVEALRRELARRLEAKVRDWEAEQALDSAATTAPAPSPAEAEPLSEQDRRINAIAARFYANRE